MSAPVLLDATPLSSGHSARGIGAALRGMLGGLAAVDPDDRPELLVRRGQEVPAGFRAREVRWPAWPLYRLPDPWPAAIGERLVRRMGARVFHATQPALAPGGASVVTCHDLIPAAYPREFLSGAGRLAERLAYRRFLARLREAALVLTPSRETAEDVVRLAGVHAGRVRQIPWGVPAPADPEGPVPGGVYVLYAGGLEPHKNAALAVRAIAGAPAGVRLAMAGPWSDRRLARLQAETRRAGADGRIDWLGYLSPGRLAAVRAGACAVLVPSRKEGFGFPVLEAMADGVPVLASDTQALREAGGDAALYLPPHDPAAWARAIGDLARDEAARSELGAKGREQAARFTWEETARLTVAAYREALA
jgi:glycosyltransferase involved in cell wall biosynthesis